MLSYYLNGVKPKNIAKWLVLLSMSMVSANSNSCCLNFDASSQKCIDCPRGTHLVKGNCLNDVPNCRQYDSNGMDCIQCQFDYKLMMNQDWVECQPFGYKETNDYILREYSPSLCYSGSNPSSSTQNIYSLLDKYFSQRQQIKQGKFSLLKVVNKFFLSNNRQEVTLFYLNGLTDNQSVRNRVKKAIAKIINNGASFEMTYFGDADQGDIDPRELVNRRRYVPFDQINSSSGSGSGSGSRANVDYGNMREQESSHYNGYGDYVLQGSSHQHSNSGSGTNVVPASSYLPTSSSSTYSDYNPSYPQRDYDPSQVLERISNETFDYQSPIVRRRDIGFITADKVLRQAQPEVLWVAQVVACYMNKSGTLKNQYRIYYKTQGSSQLFRGEVIYDTIRKKSYILNFGKVQ